MRRERLYLTDIVEAADYVADFIAGTDFQAFQKSELLRSAVVQKLAVIGEAAARVSEELKVRHSHVPWPQITAFRNILIHAYFGIDWDEVWRAAAEAVSGLAGTGRGHHLCRIWQFGMKGPWGCAGLQEAVGLFADGKTIAEAPGGQGQGQGEVVVAGAFGFELAGHRGELVD